MDKLRDLEAALLGNNLEAIWLASAAWLTQGESTAPTPKGKLSLQALDRLLALAVRCCKEQDPKNCYIMSSMVLSMAPSTIDNKEELKLMREALRGCIRSLLENFLKEEKPAPGDEIQLCIAIQNFCFTFLKILETVTSQNAAWFADILTPHCEGVAVFEAIHATAILQTPPPAQLPDVDQQKLQDLCHFCRYRVSRCVAKLLCVILKTASDIGRIGGSARMCKEATGKALLEEVRFGAPDILRQELCLELMWQICRRTKSPKPQIGDIRRPDVMVKFFEEKVAFGKMMHNTTPKEYPVKKAKMLNEVYECSGGVLRGTCSIRWGHMNREDVKATLTKHSFCLQFPGCQEPLELPWVCLELPEFLLQASCPSNGFCWPLTLRVDLFAAMVLCAFPRELVKEIDQQAVMTLTVHEDATTFIRNLHELLHKDICYKSDKAAALGKPSPSAKALGKKAAAKSQPKAQPTRRVTRSMTRSQSLTPTLETPTPVQPMRSSSEPVQRATTPTPKVHDFAPSKASPAQAVVAAHVEPADGKKKGLWEKATDIARSAKAMLGSTMPTPARAGASKSEQHSTAAAPSTLKRCRSASPAARGRSPNLLNSSNAEATSSGLNSVTSLDLPETPQPDPKRLPSPAADSEAPVKRSRSQQRQKDDGQDAGTTPTSTAIPPPPRRRSRSRAANSDTTMGPLLSPFSPLTSPPMAPVTSPALQPLLYTRTRSRSRQPDETNAKKIQTQTVGVQAPNTPAMPCAQTNASQPQKKHDATSASRTRSASPSTKLNAGKAASAPETPASPGAASVASRVSLGQAANLANEAASLGIMGPDKLRQMCSDHGLPNEGLRTELISRLLIHRLTSASRNTGDSSPLSPSFAPFSHKTSEQRTTGVQRAEPGSSNEILQRLQESQRNAQDSTAAAKARSALSTVTRKTGERAPMAKGPETPPPGIPANTPKRRVRSKSPARALYGSLSESPINKRVRSKSPSSAHGSPQKGVSDVCGAAVRSLLTLRPEQLEAECKRQGLSPRRSTHAMACRLVFARLNNLGSPESSLKTPTRARSSSKTGTPPSAPATSRARSSPKDRTPPSAPAPSRPRSAARTAPSPPSRGSARQNARPASARATSRRSPTPNPRSRTPRARSPAPRSKSPATSLLCGAPGAEKVTSPFSTPQRRRAPSSNVPTGDKVRRQSQSQKQSATPPSAKSKKNQTPRTRSPAARTCRGSTPRSRSTPGRKVEAKAKCHGKKRDGAPCSFNGSKRPTGAVFFYCGKHSDSWRTYERR